MYKRLIIVILFIFLFINNNFVYSKIENPVEVLRGINKDVLNIVNNNVSLNDNELNEVLGNYIISFIDFNEMCLLIIGKGTWKEIPINKQNDFINEFKKLVIKTYSTTLNKYIKSNVVFFENKNDDKIKYERKIQIFSEIEHFNGGKNLHVDYRLIFHKNSWKLYDLIIEGVSILKGFQAQFSNDVKKNGIDYVINKIRQHNNE
ncbi:MAG: ABC transporter substrate-binding protein [Candidatus Azosocius agrarius]|nr:MAG: ABC transporter substrate-binding protein [Gammaproteobacteria bacterium]